MFEVGTGNLNAICTAMCSFFRKCLLSASVSRLDDGVSDIYIAFEIFALAGVNSASANLGGTLRV